MLPPLSLEAEEVDIGVAADCAVDDAVEHQLVRLVGVVVRLGLARFVLRSDDEDPRVRKPEQPAGINLVDSRGDVPPDRDVKDVGNGFFSAADVVRLRDGRDAGMVEQQAIGLIEIGAAGERELHRRSGFSSTGKNREEPRLGQLGHGRRDADQTRGSATRNRKLPRARRASLP